MPVPNSSWQTQTVEDYPFLYSAVKADNKWWLLQGFDSNSDPALIEVNPTTGAFTEHTMGGYANDLSTAAVGNKVISVWVGSGSTTVWFTVHDVTTHTSVQYSPTAPVAGTRYGPGAVGPDGKVYFAPKTGSGGSLPMVYNPSDNSFAWPNFGGTWVSDNYGWSMMGGDGAMYFLPGLVTTAGGGYFSGNTIARLNFTTMTITTIPLPLRPYSTSSLEDTYVWAHSAPNGVYAGGMFSGVYKITSSGATLIGSSDIWTDVYVNQGDLTENAEFRANHAVTASDGKIYSIGYTYRSSGNYTPCLLRIDPSNDSVRYKEYPAQTGKPFQPTTLYPVGDTLRAWSYGNVEFPPVFVTDLPTSYGPDITFAHGSNARSVALGNKDLGTSGTIG